MGLGYNNIEATIYSGLYLLPFAVERAAEYEAVHSAELLAERAAEHASEYVD